MIWLNTKTINYLGYKQGNNLVFTGVNGLSDRELTYHQYGGHIVMVDEKLMKILNNLEDNKVVEFLVKTNVKTQHCVLHTKGTLYKIRLPKESGHKPFNMTITYRG